MYQITEQQIDFMLDDLEKRGIRTESLRLNLLDHICILIEENLAPTGDFYAFYYSTIQAFYQTELSELETETNYLLLQNNFIMKKALIISGLLAAFGFVAGSISKIFLTRFTDFLLVFGFASFVLLFLPLALVVLIKGFRSRTDVLIYVSGTVSAVLYFVCMMCKCLGIPSFNPQSVSSGFDNVWLVMWLTALGIGALVFVPVYLIKGLSKPESKIPAIIVSGLLIAFIGVQFRLTSLQPFRTPEKQHVSALKV